VQINLKYLSRCLKDERILRRVRQYIITNLIVKNIIYNYYKNIFVSSTENNCKSQKILNLFVQIFVRCYVDRISIIKLIDSVVFLWIQGEREELVEAIKIYTERFLSVLEI
jgi:hypothetical protein